MKKYLVPVIGLLFGTASAQQTIDVTVTCHEIDGSYWKLGREIFDPIRHTVEVKDDGSYTIRKFLNSDLDVNFSIGTKRVYNGLESVKYRFPDEVWNSPVLSFSYPVWTSGVETSPEARYEIKVPDSDQSYMYKVMPVDGLEYYSLGQFVPVPKKELSFPVVIYRNLSVASFQGEDDRGKHYRVWIASEFKIPFGDKIDEFGDENPSYKEEAIDGWAVFEMTVNNDPVDVSYVDSSDNALFQNTKSTVLHREDRSTAVYNFMNSGAMIGLRTTGDEVAPGKSAIVFTDGFDSSKSPDEYQALEGASYSLVTVDNRTVTGPVMVRPAGCYAVQTEELSINKARYKAYLDVKVGDVTGYASFEMTGSPLKKGEKRKVTLMEWKSMDFEPAGEYECNIDIIDDNNFTFYDFLGSGLNIPFILSDVKAPTAYDYFDAFQELDLPDDYGKWAEIKDGNDNPVTSDQHKVILIPDYLNYVIETNLEKKDGTLLKVSNPMIEVYDNAPDLGKWGMPDVCHYKDGDNVRKVYNVYFQGENKNYCLTWEVKGDESGISDIVSDGDNAPAEWFNLQGVRVSGDNLAPGIYIKRQGSKTVKVLVK